MMANISLQSSSNAISSSSSKISLSGHHHTFHHHLFDTATSPAMVTSSALSGTTVGGAGNSNSATSVNSANNSQTPTVVSGKLVSTVPGSIVRAISLTEANKHFFAKRLNGAGGTATLTPIISNGSSVTATGGGNVITLSQIKAATAAAAASGANSGGATVTSATTSNGSNVLIYNIKATDGAHGATGKASTLFFTTTSDAGLLSNVPGLKFLTSAPNGALASAGEGENAKPIIIYPKLNSTSSTSSASSTISNGILSNGTIVVSSGLAPVNGKSHCSVKQPAVKKIKLEHDDQLSNGASSIISTSTPTTSPLLSSVSTNKQPNTSSSTSMKLYEVSHSHASEKKSTTTSETNGLKCVSKSNLENVLPSPNGPLQHANHSNLSSARQLNSIVNSWSGSRSRYYSLNSISPCLPDEIFDTDEEEDFDDGPMGRKMNGSFSSGSYGATTAASTKEEINSKPVMNGTIKEEAMDTTSAPAKTPINSTEAAPVGGSVGVIKKEEEETEAKPIVPALVGGVTTLSPNAGKSGRASTARRKRTSSSSCSSSASPPKRTTNTATTNPTTPALSTVSAAKNTRSSTKAAAAASSSSAAPSVNGKVLLQSTVHPVTVKVEVPIVVSPCPLANTSSASSPSMPELIAPPAKAKVVPPSSVVPTVAPAPVASPLSRKEALTKQRLSIWKSLIKEVVISHEKMLTTRSRRAEQRMIIGRFCKAKVDAKKVPPTSSSNGNSTGTSKVITKNTIVMVKRKDTTPSTASLAASTLTSKALSVTATFATAMSLPKSGTLMSKSGAVVTLAPTLNVSNVVSVQSGSLSATGGSTASTSLPITLSHCGGNGATLTAPPVGTKMIALKLTPEQIRNLVGCTGEGGLPSSIFLAKTGLKNGSKTITLSPTSFIQSSAVGKMGSGAPTKILQSKRLVTSAATPVTGLMAQKIL